MAIFRFAVAAAAAFALQAVHAQTDAGTQINSLAPQLQIFAGSGANFQALATGLTAGTTVTISTTTADGSTQVVSFTPPSAMSASDAARALETARQLLISRAIVAPTAEQIAAALMGGTLPTALGGAPVRGVLTGVITTDAVAVRREFTGAPTFAGSSASFQNLTTGLRNGAAITLASPTGQTITFTVPGGPMSQSDVASALLLAAQQLALQGILNPTSEQIRAALLGGQVLGVNGAVQLAGVLQGRVANTSAPAATRNTSDTLLPRLTSETPSQMMNTSASPATNTSATPPSAVPAPGITGAGSSAAPPARFGVAR